MTEKTNTASALSAQDVDAMISELEHSRRYGYATAYQREIDSHIATARAALNDGGDFERLDSVAARVVSKIGGEG